MARSAEVKTPKTAIKVGLGEAGALHSPTSVDIELAAVAQLGGI